MDFLFSYVHVLIWITKILQPCTDVKVLLLSSSLSILLLFPSIMRACPPPIPPIVFLFYFMTCTLEFLEIKIP